MLGGIVQQRKQNIASSHKVLILKFWRKQTKNYPSNSDTNLIYWIKLPHAEM